MIKIKDIQEYIDDEMIETIFREREEEIYSEVGKKEDIEVKKIKEDYPVDHNQLLVVIRNLSPHFQNTREGIIKALESYYNRETLIMAHDNEKFYKVGFCDGVRTILESIKNSSK